MHEMLAAQRGKKELKEKCIDEEFTAANTHASEIQEFRSLRRAFPRVIAIANHVILLLLLF